jgi:misacylated tRNA(Ala) deacylase
MTDRLYQRDMTLGRFSARVIECRGQDVVLDRTAFFPAGGGVQGDRGNLVAGGREIAVVETHEQENAILHRIEGEAPASGTEVEGQLDWPRRYALMRYHTAMHVLTGVMFKDFGVRVTGNQITPEKARVDFAFPEFDRAILENGFRRSNEVIAKDLPVRVAFVSAAEAQSRPELFKLETEFPHDLAELRLVEIVGFDTQADGGCHVAKLSEIGKLVFTKAENKGKANRRVYFVVE